MMVPSWLVKANDCTEPIGGNLGLAKPGIKTNKTIKNPTTRTPKKAK